MRRSFSRFFWLNTHFQRFCCAEEVIPNERHERRFGFFLLIRDPAASVGGYATPIGVAITLDRSLKFVHLIYHLTCKYRSRKQCPEIPQSSSAWKVDGRGSLLMIAFMTRHGRHALKLSVARVLAIVALLVFVGDGFDLIVGKSPTLDEQLGDLLVRTAERLQLTVSMLQSLIHVFVFVSDDPLG